MAEYALLVADDPAYRDWLDDCLEGELSLLSADARDAEGLAAEVRDTPDIGVVFVQFEEAEARQRAGLVEGLLARHPDLPVIAVGDREASDAVLAAMRAGVRDYLVRRRDDANLGELVQRVMRRAPRAAPEARGAGRTYAVVSTTPVPGVPFLAEHLALPLAEAAGEGRRVLLLDLSTPGGSSLVFLDVDQGYTALDALRDAERCDETLADTAFSRYRDRLYVLGLPEEVVGPPHIDPEKLGLLLDNFAGIFSQVIVAADAGVGIEALATVITRAEKTMLLSNQSVLQSRQNKHLLHALRQVDCPLDRVELAIDNYQERVGLDPERIATLLDLPLQARFTGRTQARIEAMNAGEPLYDQTPKDNYCREVRELLARWTGESLVREQRRGLLGRLFG
ncbi:hypothetical protein PC39_03357 [Salinisphaera sp. PC39]|uniref:AAA family ATPase n=1 Tax=Salinisphaera sp. PC39 TaxID=1304156 RepID=UPI00333F6CB9